MDASSSLTKGRVFTNMPAICFSLKIQTVNGGDTDAEPLLPFDPAQIDRQSHIKHGKRGYLLFPAEACDHTVHPVGDCKRPADSHRADLGVGVFLLLLPAVYPSAWTSSIPCHVQSIF